MGLDFSYRLYFKRAHLWDVLQGLVEICDLHDPPALIHFPDHVLSIPLDPWGEESNDLRHDASRFGFAIVINFERDDVILEYINRMYRNQDTYRNPADSEGQKIGIGIIYLAVYQEIPEHPDSDLVLFDFGTTGTRMSLLFDESTSIRRTFTKFLSDFQGVCGVFNREDNGELFWLNGQETYKWIQDPFMMPDEIEHKLGEQRDGFGDDQ